MLGTFFHTRIACQKLNDLSPFLKGTGVLVESMQNDLDGRGFLLAHEVIDVLRGEKAKALLNNFQGYKES